MAADVLMPKLGLLMTEGVVVKWLKADGQPVARGEPIVTIMTRKITYQVVAPAAGTLRQVARVEQTLRIGERLALIAAPGEALPGPGLPQPARPEPSGRPGRLNTPAARPVRGEVVQPVAAEGAGGAPDRNGWVMASPWARRLARELSVDLKQVTGTGSDGCILGRDVQRFALRLSGPAAGGRTNGSRSAYASRDQLIPFTGVRRVIAGRMMESLHGMAQATITVEADVTDLVRLLRRRAGAAPELIDVLIQAAAAALVEHPRLNATVAGDEIRLLDEVHIGFAIAPPEGVLVPVVREADRLSLDEIAEERRRLLAAAEAGSLTVDEVTGSTFTLTDLGPFGVDFFVPIINPPEVGILGAGRVLEKPAVRRGKVTARSMLMLCLAFDQRVVDAAPAAAFLAAVAARLENPGAAPQPPGVEQAPAP